ncbi:hypothetical protein BGZ73_001141, partial [Actinomortierella ambigua]
MSLTADEEAALRSQLEELSRKLDALELSMKNRKNKQHDPQITTRPPLRFYRPSAEEAERFPCLVSTDRMAFFEDQDGDDDVDSILEFPRNLAMGYAPPTVPSIVYQQMTKEERAQDKTLCSIQRRLALLTRPIDNFLHKQYSMSKKGDFDREELLQACGDFGVGMRKELRALAGMIN